MPALRPIIKAKAKVGGIKLSEVGFNVQACRNVKAENGLKTSGRSLSKGAANKFGTHNMGSAEMIERELGIKIGKVNRPDHTQVIDPERGTKGYAARLGDSQISRKHGSQSPARRAASAHIARIPTALSRHIAQVYYPLSAGRSAQQ